MSLIIGLRCKDGCLVIADTRSHIKTNGVLTYDDTFEKVILNKGHIVYNHGYNRIHDNDWKLCRDQLIPDKDNTIYQAIAVEMKSKEDKTAFYVFMMNLSSQVVMNSVGTTPLSIFSANLSVQVTARAEPFWQGSVD